MTAKEHNKLIGIFLMAHGGLQALVMIFIGLIYGGMGTMFLVAGKKDEKFIGLIFLVMILVIGFVFLLFIIPQLLGGWKVLKEKPGARTWGIVGSILSLLSFPLGTAVGVYGLWFLFGEEGKRFYMGGGSPGSMSPPQPPPPQSWQQ
jgi:hypothetical protein